jgi:hypothetical protein
MRPLRLCLIVVLSRNRSLKVSDVEKLEWAAKENSRQNSRQNSSNSAAI